MKALSAAAGLALLVVSWPAAAQSEPEILAVVNGENVNRTEVFDAAADALDRLASTAPRPDTYDRDRLEILWNALDSIVEERLIALEAASLNMSTGELLDIEIESNVYPPTDAEVDAFYRQNQDQIPLPLEEARPQVREFMIDQSRRNFRNTMIRRYKEKYAVRTFLDPLRTDVATAGHPSRGPDDAPVTILEFGDFQCPFCGALHPTLGRVREVYADTVRIVFRNFPLRNIHPQAQKAAEAALCADDQGRFWDYHDSLFENQSMLEVDSLKSRARDMGLNTAAFDTCLDLGAKADAVQRDVDAGRAAGATGTPTLFINGRFMSGPSPREIQNVIEDELDRAGVER